ncbi:unnamed protein product [Cuscuta campestris]|uniref:Reverse transcriptase domain-containing protein n=1 Tax=Cuscuta campestris TaxID=132261 RepID=A0A484M4A7_9ASTE|nr:unnamed protein product [Cuscuta campestris]
MTILTSWTDKNPRRRMWKCDGNGTRKCRSWEWLDPPICERAKKLIPGLLKKSSAKDEEIKLLNKRNKEKKIGAFMFGFCAALVLNMAIFVLFIAESAKQMHCHLGFSAVQNKIWVLWNEENMRLTQVQEEDQAISCRFIDISTNKAITITTVYGQHTREGRKLLWETLAFHMPLDECWLVGGDFNAIASPLEHKGSSSPCASSMADMDDCIQACELSEPQVKGSLFTWMGKRSTGTVHRKLDRILLNVNFRNLFDDITTTILSRATSDHKPLILECKNSIFLGPKPFRYLNFWGYHKDFHDVVSKAWGSFGWEAGGGMRGLASKLHNLKPILRDWSYVTFGDIFKNLDEAEQQAEEAVRKFEIDSSEENRIAMSLANARLILTSKKESQFWFQKANVKWLKEGDTSTKYFHSLVKGRQKKNLISKIKKEDGTYTSHTEEIGNTFLSHFQNILGMECNSIPESTLVNIPTLITAEDNSLLVELPEEEEIWEAVWALNPNSSAGPDGYNGQFFRQAWHIIRADVIKACQEFFLGIPVPKAFGSTQIILIPKKEGAAAIGDYRPISLSTFMSKIITKILANRLSRLLPKIISSEQAGFQNGKGVEEQILLTNELVHSIENSSRGGNVIVKLDMEKAFDKLSWNYLRAVLGRFGFDISAVNLLMSNLVGTFMSVKGDFTAKAIDSPIWKRICRIHSIALENTFCNDGQFFWEDGEFTFKKAFKAVKAEEPDFLLKFPQAAIFVEEVIIVIAMSFYTVQSLKSHDKKTLNGMLKLVLPGWILWNLWKRHNKIKHDGRKVEAKMVIMDVSNLMQSWIWSNKKVRRTIKRAEAEDIGLKWMLIP